MRSDSSRLARAVAFTLIVLACASSLRAAVLFEDTMYWRPGGVTLLNPASPPVDAYVKIQETVYDDASSRTILSQQLSLGLMHGNGGVIPASPINLYAYSITNLNYGNGPFTNQGLGIGGFTIPNPAGVPYVIYAPNFANDRWHEHQGDPNFNWQIDRNANLKDGDGAGILLGQTHNTLDFVVPDGTPHGFIQGATVNTWTGGGSFDSLEEPVAVKIDFVTGFVSGPVPEPATGLALIGLLSVIARRLRR
jgi:hypothetical protein